MANIGSGLDAQFGMKNEAVVGTGVTVDRFFEILDADPILNPTYISSAGLRAGKRFKRSAQVGISRKTVSGGVTLPMTMKNQGIWWKHLIGSTATATVVTGSAFKQVHTPGTTMKGLSFTAQLGRPEPETGTVVPFTYNGCKVTDWEIGIQDGEETQLKVTIDGWNETTATGLAAATYIPANDTWNFADCNLFKIGGTPSTAAGETTIAGGVSVASVVESLTLKGTTKYATERYGVGNAGIKKEQLENDFCEISGDFSGEFNKAQFYDAFGVGSVVPIQVDSVGPAIPTGGGATYLLSFIIPAAIITEFSADVSGPDLISCKGSFTAYDGENGTDPVFQVKIVSTDTAP